MKPTLVDGLIPIRYRLDDRNRYEGARDGSKADPCESVGFSAQNVKTAAEAAGLPPELFIDSSNPEKLGYKTGSLEAFLVLEIQSLKRQLAHDRDGSTK
jgi:hypothetical protein